jgi:hypothetical protein
LSKCPSCGYEYSPGNKTLDIRKLEFARDMYTRKILKIACKGIMLHVPSDKKRWKHYAFLFGIQSIPNEPVEWATNIFIKREEYKMGKGFAYLRTMIQNADKDWNVKKRAELKMRGKTPKSIKQKRKELGYVSRNTVSSKGSTSSGNSSNS